MFDGSTSARLSAISRMALVNSGRIGLLGLGTWLFAAAQVHASNLTPGNLVIVRLGDGSVALSSAATPVFLDEYSPGGALVQTISMPTAVSGSNQPLTDSGSATSEGFLSLSANGQYLINVGYGAVPGTTGVVASSAVRVIARTDMSGNVDTSTALTDAYTANNLRSATSDDGTQFWTAGTASGTAGGVRYVAGLGATTSTFLSTTPTNTRVVGIFGGQLYVSSASLTFQGVSTVGSGLPTTSGQTTAILPGFPTASGPSSYDYFFADASTLYVADDRASAAGGIQKWTFNGTTWLLQYTLNPATNIGCRSVTGTLIGTTSVLFATTGDNKIMRVVDAGAGSAFSLVATPGTNTVFRGLRFLPTTCSAGPDCNANNIPDGCDIALGISVDLNHNSIPDSCEQNGGTPYCFGDGSGTACPCGNNSAVGAHQGCAHTSGGAALVGSGITSVSADSLVLTVSNLQQPAGNSGTVLFFQGDAQVSAPFNDGLRCAGGNVARLGPKLHLGTTATYPEAGDPSVSVRGAIPAAGGAYNYQAWFRTFPSACGTHSNLSNGLSVVWAP